MDSYDFWLAFWDIMLIIVICIISVPICQTLDLNYINNVPVDVYVKDEIVYSGINGCVEVTSGGDTTTITIMGKWMCFFPLKTYTDHNIKVVTKHD